MRLKLLMALLIAGAAVALTLYTSPRLHLSNREREQEKNLLIADYLYDELGKSLEIPLTIVRTMTTNDFLKEALREEESGGPARPGVSVPDYLSSLQKQFGCGTVFVVSEKTRCYYTPDGIAKTVNPEQEPYDIWYQRFLDSGKAFALDTDRDQMNDYRWAVFVNARITASDGSLMGVCGLGLPMDEIQDILGKAEKQWGVKATLIDGGGLVQADVDSSNIENAYISDAIADGAGADSFSYAKRSFGGFRMTRNMDKFGWYLVVQGFGSLSDRDTLSAALVIALYLILAALLVLVLLSRSGAARHMLTRTLLPEDPLTGLPNRNYVNESFGELGVFNTTRYKSMAMFDIDSFKVANETMDGDAILLKIVQLTKDMFGESGMIFRWNGDEFVLFLEIDADEAEMKFRILCAYIQKETGVTISVGIVQVDLFESIKRNYHRAVLQCYAVKEAGGNGVSRKS